MARAARGSDAARVDSPDDSGGASCEAPLAADAGASVDGASKPSDAPVVAGAPIAGAAVAGALRALLADLCQGPLGIKLETSERPRVEAVTNDSEHHASLRRGDEVVGIGSTSFFESDDDVAKGGDGVFSTDDCYELLADAVEREAFPLTLHFRRRREADADVFVLSLIHISEPTRPY